MVLLKVSLWSHEVEGRAVLRYSRSFCREQRLRWNFRNFWNLRWSCFQESILSWNVFLLDGFFILSKQATQTGNTDKYFIVRCWDGQYQFLDALCQKQMTRTQYTECEDRAGTPWREYLLSSTGHWRHHISGLSAYYVNSSQTHFCVEFQLDNSRIEWRRKEKKEILKTFSNKRYQQLQQ